jgi:ABC-type Fe3+/spermidine/putrescine transport system ATPase subunit
VAVLELVNLEKWYDSTHGVGPVSLTVNSGEFLSMLGPSGCGKSTALRCIAGLEDPTRGMIRLDGANITDKPPNRRNIGMVFQQHALFPHMTVFNNVAFSLKLRQLPKSEVEQAVAAGLALVKLQGFEQRYPNQLSGGQQQRVALARTLVMKPTVLLFDEPLSSLDLKLRNEMRAEIKELHRKLEITTIYVTHDQGEALALSDRIAVLAEGKIEQVGTAREIYETPQSAFVADFIGESNLIDGRVEGIEDDGTLRLTTNRGMHLVSRYAPGLQFCAAGDRVAIVIRHESIQLADASDVGPNLFRARIEVSMYMGEGTQSVISVERTEHRLMAANKTRSRIGQMAVGASALFRVDPHDVKVVPAAPSTVQ